MIRVGRFFLFLLVSAFVVFGLLYICRKDNIEFIPGEWIKVELKNSTIPAETILMVSEENETSIPAEGHEKNGYIDEGIVIILSDTKIRTSGEVWLYKLPKYEILEKTNLVEQFNEKLGTNITPAIYFVGH